MPISSQNTEIVTRKEMQVTILCVQSCGNDQLKQSEVSEIPCVQLQEKRHIIKESHVYVMFYVPQEGENFIQQTLSQ